MLILRITTFKYQPFRQNDPQALFQKFLNRKNPSTSKQCIFCSRQDFASGESSGIFLDIQVYNDVKSQHLLTFSQHVAFILLDS